MDEDGDKVPMMQTMKGVKEQVVAMDCIEEGDFPLATSVGNWVIIVQSVIDLQEWGEDMFPLLAQLPNRSNDYAVDIKDKARPSKLTAKEKGKGKVVNVITLDKLGQEEACVMPLRKRTTKDKEGWGTPSPSKEKGKEKESDDVKVKKKRAP